MLMMSFSSDNCPIEPDIQVANNNDHGQNYALGRIQYSVTKVNIEHNISCQLMHGGVQ